MADDDDESMGDFSAGPINARILAREMAEDEENEAMEEWEALGEAGQKAHVEAEAALLAEHAQALAAHESAAPPTATSFKVALHDPALVQRLLRLPADGFRAVEWHGPYGPVTQQACVRKADLRYDVKDSALKLKCELQYLRGNEVDE